MDKEQKSFKLDTSTPKAGDFKKHPIKYSFYGLIILTMLIMMISSFGNDSSSTTTATAPIQEQKKEYTETQAYIEARHILEKFLKAPSTAKFPYSNEAKITRFKDDGFEVSSYVDSQNSFGAMIRSNWTVKFHYVGDKIDLFQVVIDGEEMFRKPEAPKSN